MAAYDYIIVGGGTAGCVLANRLTQEGGKKVLMVEAGSSDYKNKLIQIPAGVLKLFKNPKFDWDFDAESEESVAGRNIYLCRGKVLGGSSCANVLLYHRGNIDDYKQWAQLSGSDEWSPESVLPTFKKSQNDFRGPSDFHGIGGEYNVDEVRYQNPLARTFLEAAVAAGGDANDDFNNWSHSQEGYGRFQVNEKNGARCSAASGFLDPVLGRKNLRVKSDAQVNKITFDENKCATGIEYKNKKGQVKHVALAPGGEVLLAGGAIASPQILMLSGIGPQAELQKHGIDCVHDLPGVGQNLQDHPAAIISYKCSEGNEGVSVSSKIRIKGTTLTNPSVIAQWMIAGSGPLTSTGCDHGGFAKTQPGLTSPDLQMRFIAAQSLTADGMGTYTRFRESASLGDGFSVQSIVSRPHSRGSVKLRSNNPADKPVIKTGFVSDAGGKDIATLREGLRLTRKIIAAQPFDQYRGEEVFPGSNIQSDEDLDNYIRESIHTSNALVGTCKMGKENDNMAVVTPDLKVRGVSGLRIADASVMPKIPGGQTGAPTVMIAEKMANFLASA